MQFTITRVALTIPLSQIVFCKFDKGLHGDPVPKNKKKIYIFIVTNQAGIAKGFFQLSDFYNLQIQFKSFLENKKIFINDIEFCPYHKDAKIINYKKNSLYRKPGNLMIKKINKKWFFNKKKSFMIGDKKTDYMTAKKSNLYFEYVENDLYLQVKKICKKLNI